MSNGYESTEAFLQGIEDELRGENTRSSGRSAGNGSSERYNDDRGEKRRRQNEDSEDRSSSSRRHRSGGGDDYHEDDRNRRSNGSRRHMDDRDRESYSRRHERDYYQYDHNSGGGGGYRSDRYDRGYGGNGRSRGNDERRSRGGGSGWRDGPVRESSPAIRRSQTPPNTRPISERIRKNTKWDIPPEGFENVTPLQAKATGLFGISGQSRTLGVQANATKNNMIGAAGGGGGGGSGVAVPMAGVTVTGDAAATSSMGATQSNRQARRLYVGNIGFNATEENLNQFFNDQMRKMNFTIEEGDPVIGTQVNNEKGYAFVEIRSVAEATNAMSFDGIIFQGQSIKIRRPKDYVGPNPHPPAKLHVPGVISTNVPDGPNKIYIGGLPTYLVEEQVIELLKSFGELRSFNLVRESGVNGASKGYAFCEYVDTNITDLAIQGLNDMELGDKRLLVQRASVGTTGGQRNSSATGANNAPLATGSNGTTILNAPVEGGGLLNGLTESGPGEPTKAMMLLNCVTSEELVDDEEYQEIVEDMREECSKYGIVLDMRIPRPDRVSKSFAVQAWRQESKSEEEETTTKKEREGVGKVYVMFTDPLACQNALKAIAGRQFAGRTVIAAFISEDSFPSDEDGGKDAKETAEQTFNGQ